MFSTFILALLVSIVFSSFLSLVSPALVVVQPTLIFILFFRQFKQIRIMWFFTLMSGFWYDLISSLPFGSFLLIFTSFTLIASLFDGPEAFGSRVNQTAIFGFAGSWLYQIIMLLLAGYSPWFTILLPAFYSGILTALTCYLVIIIAHKLRLYA